MVHYEVIVEKEYSDGELHSYVIECATLDEAFLAYTSNKVRGEKVSIHKVVKTLIKES